MNVNDCWGGWQEWTARKIGKVDDDKGMIDMEVVDDRTARIGFCDMGPPYKSGPRKGLPRFLTKTRRDVYIRSDEVDVSKSDHEKETGECSGCLGRGDVAHSWSAANGSKRRTCSRCGGSGAS